MRLVRIAVVGGALAVAAAALAQAPGPTPAILAAGKVAYEGSAAGCHSCHGLTGEGNGPVAFALKPPPRNFTKDLFKGGETVDQVYATITSGLPSTSMVGYPHLSDDTRRALAYYVLSFRPRK